MPPIISRPGKNNLGPSIPPLRVHRGAPEILPAPKPLAALARRGVWDRALDEPAPKGLPSDRQGMRWLAVVARLGLALFLTAGFASGLRLCTDTALISPQLEQACACFFIWVLALLSCVVCPDK